MSTYGILLYLIMGGLVFFGFSRIRSFTRSRKAEKRFVALVYLGGFLIAFGVAWCYTSFLENEPASAYMGLFVFSGLGVVLGFLGLWNVIDLDTSSTSQKADESAVAISWKQGLAFVLLVLFTVTLPATWMFRSATGIISDREEVTTFLKDTLLSDEALPIAIREALEYEAWLTRYKDPLMKRLIIAALSGVKRDEMLKLFNYVAPEKERIALLNQATNAFYDWLEGEDVYPALTIQISTYLNNIRNNAENLLLWTFSNFPIPACGPIQIRKLEQGDFGNDLQALITCVPPESLRPKVAAVGADLLRSQIAENNPPQVLDLGAKMKESPVQKITTAKRHTNRLLFAGSTLWLIPVLLMLIGLGLVVRSRKDLASWLAWPLALTGLLGLIIGSRLPGLSFLHGVPSDTEVPGAAVGIGRKLGLELAVMLERAMFTPFLILALSGIVLLVVTRRKKALQMAGRIKQSMMVVFGS